MYILKNDHLQIGIQHNGAELCSIKNLKNNKEYMWQADPEIWGSHAPNLFPVIGALKGNQIKYEIFPEGFLGISSTKSTALILL